VDVLLVDTVWYSCNKGLKDKQVKVVDTCVYLGRVGMSYRKL
jgi:hypothetical protein